MTENWFTAVQQRVAIWRHGLSSAATIETHLTMEEKLALFNLVRTKRPRVIVEIGSYLGASSCFMAAAIARYRLNSRLYCVDTWRNDAMSEGARDTYEEFLHNTAPFSQAIRPVRQMSVDAAKEFREQIDLLFIDGDHRYAAVREDWTCWSRHLGETAVVAFHDIGWAEGVQRVVAEQVSPLAAFEERLPNLYWAVLPRVVRKDAH